MCWYASARKCFGCWNKWNMSTQQALIVGIKRFKIILPVPLRQEFKLSTFHPNHRHIAVRRKTFLQHRLRNALHR